MKPITLTPAQLDAALGLPEAGCNWCGWHATYASDADALSASYAHKCPPPSPRLECTCAERDYGLCPNCRVSG